jgi:hypothetical protein
MINKIEEWPRHNQEFKNIQEYCDKYLLLEGIYQ